MKRLNEAFAGAMKKLRQKSDEGESLDIAEDEVSPYSLPWKASSKRCSTKK